MTIFFFLQLHWFSIPVWWNWHHNNVESSDVYSLFCDKRKRRTWKDVNQSMGFLNGLEHVTSPFRACFLFCNWGRRMLCMTKADNDRGAGSVSRITRHFLHTECYCYTPCGFVKELSSTAGTRLFGYILSLPITVIPATVVIKPSRWISVYWQSQPSAAFCDHLSLMSVKRRSQPLLSHLECSLYFQSNSQVSFLLHAAYLSGCLCGLSFLFSPHFAGHVSY